MRMFDSYNNTEQLQDTKLAGTNNTDIELQMVVVRTTPKAILCFRPENDLEHCWLPRSQVIVVDTITGDKVPDPQIIAGGIYNMQMPDWLASKKELA